MVIRFLAPLKVDGPGFGTVALTDVVEAIETQAMVDMCYEHMVTLKYNGYPLTVVSATPSVTVRCGKLYLCTTVTFTGEKTFTLRFNSDFVCFLKAAIMDLNGSLVDGWADSFTQRRISVFGKERTFELEKVSHVELHSWALLDGVVKKDPTIPVKELSSLVGNVVVGDFCLGSVLRCMRKADGKVLGRIRTLRKKIKSGKASKSDRNELKMWEHDVNPEITMIEECVTIGFIKGLCEFFKGDNDLHAKAYIAYLEELGF